jgi:hypothetical protein
MVGLVLVFYVGHLDNAVRHYYVMSHGVLGTGTILGTEETREVRNSQTYVEISYGGTVPMQKASIPVTSAKNFTVGSTVPIHYLANQPASVTLDYDDGEVLKEMVLGSLILVIMVWFCIAKLRRRT